MARLTLAMTMDDGTAYSASADVSDADADRIVEAYSGPLNAGQPAGSLPLTPQEVFAAFAAQLLGQVTAFVAQYEHAQALAAVPPPTPISVTPVPPTSPPVSPPPPSPAS